MIPSVTNPHVYGKKIQNHSFLKTLNLNKKINNPKCNNYILLDSLISLSNLNENLFEHIVNLVEIYKVDRKENNLARKKEVKVKVVSNNHIPQI